MRIVIVGLAFVVCSVCSGSGTTLTFDSLPSAQEGWRYENLPDWAEENLFSISESILTLNTLGRGLGYPPTGGYGSYAYDDIDATEPFVLLFRARCIEEEVQGLSGTPQTFYASIVANGHIYGVVLGVDGLAVANGGHGDGHWVVFHFNNSQFHDYVISATPGIDAYTVTVDGTYIFKGNAEHVPGNKLAFGDGSSGGNVRAEISALTFCQPYPPENEPPIADAGADRTAKEGDTVSFSGSFTDPDSADTHTIQWNFGDGATASGTLTTSHVYGDNGVYTVTLTVTDSKGGVGSDTLTVTVKNAPPVVEAGPDQTITEGETVNLSGSFTDPGSADTPTIQWDFGDGATASGTLTPSHAYEDDGVYPVTLTVTDSRGGVGSDTLTVTVNNVAPAATIDAVEQPNANFVLPQEVLTFHGSFTDPGIRDTHTLTWDFGDGKTASGTLDPTHAYAQPGVYTVTLTVTDDDGGVGTASVEVSVDSPAGAVGVVIEDIEALNLPAGTQESLTSKLHSAIDSLAQGQDGAAVNKLGAFINQVEAQRGKKKLAGETADALIADAQAIIRGVQTN